MQRERLKQHLDYIVKRNGRTVVTMIIIIIIINIIIIILIIIILLLLLSRLKSQPRTVTTADARSLFVNMSHTRERENFRRLHKGYKRITRNAFSAYIHIIDICIHNNEQRASIRPIDLHIQYTPYDTHTNVRSSSARLLSFIFLLFIE